MSLIHRQLLNRKLKNRVQRARYLRLRLRVTGPRPIPSLPLQLNL
jgi:hypothetical protein